MILIAESGSTKTEWIVVNNGDVTHKILTEGLNPLMHTVESMTMAIRASFRLDIFEEELAHIYFYGAGCATDVQKEFVASVLKSVFGTRSSLFIESDLLAAARALFHKEKGIACILGTGSNSCFYDGQKIVKNVPSLGYILGDEGGGAVLGKMFLSDCLKGLAPADLANHFFSTYQINYADVLDRIYKQPFPNRYLAGFSTFLIEHIDNEYVYKLAYSNFESFFKRSIQQYNYKEYPLGFVGSLSFFYEKVLRDVASDFDIDIYKIIQSPMDGLIAYHTEN